MEFVFVRKFNQPIGQMWLSGWLHMEENTSTFWKENVSKFEYNKQKTKNVAQTFVLDQKQILKVAITLKK